MKNTLLRVLKISAISLLVLIMTCVLMWSGFAVSAGLAIPEGHNIDYVRGIWMPVPTDAFRGVIFDADRLREDGVNTISLGPLALNRTVSVLSRPFYALLVKRAHREGFAVHLAPLSWGPGFDYDSDHSDMLDSLTKEAVYWAEFSQTYNVEYYSPQNEHDVVLGNALGAEWAQEVLPQVRDVYEGEIILKLGHINTDEGETGDYLVPMRSFDPEAKHDEWEVTFSDATGYDYLMVDIFPPDNLVDHDLFLDDLERILMVANDEVEKKGLKGSMVGEFAYPVGKPGYSESIMPGPVVSADDQAVMIGEYLETAMPYVDGIVYCGWRMAGYRIADMPAEDVIREYYREGR